MNTSRPGLTIGIRFAIAIALASVLRSQMPCAPWTVTPVPFNPGWDGGAVLEDVSGLSGDSAWAVGRYHATTAGNSETFTLAMRWDGSGWVHHPSPSPTLYAGGTSARLYAVGMVSENDVWAGGAAVGNAGGASVGDWVLVEHWDGSSWQVVPPPAPPGGISVNFSGTRIRDIVALASNDVWFGGYWAEPNASYSVTWRPLAMHWDGSGLTVYPTPAPYSGSTGFGIVSMSALAPNDIWAACAVNSASGASAQNVILHWDGSSWSQVPVPATTGNPPTTASHTLRKIVAIAPNDVWVLGTYYYPSAPFALHYDGTSWNEIPGAPYATTAAALGPNAIYCGTDVVTLYDGSAHSTVETFPGVSFPSIVSMDRFSWCGIWAVGRTFVGPQLQLQPFAARMAPPTAQASVTPRLACAFPAPPSSLYCGAPLLGQPLVFAVGDPSNAAALTPALTQTHVVVSAQAATTACGVPIAGMGIGSAPGELLVDVAPGNVLLVLGPTAWGGPGAPATHSVPIPGLPYLAGISVHAQAVLWDPAGPSAPGVLTNALDLVLGY